MKNLFIFEPAGQIENTGDLLINKAALDMYRRYGDIVINDTYTPSWFVEQISNENDVRLKESNKGGVLKYIKKSGNKNPYTNVYYVLPPGHITRKGLRSAAGSIVKASRFFIYRMFGINIIRAGFSIGPFDTCNAISEKIISNIYCAYGVRDKQSQQLAENIGIKNLRYSPDYAWTYQPNESKKPFRFDIESLENAVVISFRANVNGTEHDSNYLGIFQKQLNELISFDVFRGQKIILTYQVLYDRQACCEIYESLKDKCAEKGINISFIDEKLLLEDANLVYKKAYCIISNRLHVLLLAGKNKTLPIPLIIKRDNKKIIGILNDNGLAHTIIDIHDENIAQKINILFGKRHSIIEQYDKVSKSNTSLITKEMQRILNK
ncbi:polysaccharide pyruvyl transferase family protein [Halotalea alkalilenta]|uniref:polysaccharide pyruvyl transferase family protein n=1 Tax=Halotalea alkalilenta TaxID=376489 RepID=UPI0009DCBE3C|nr:polysaccharide pyruvyl transferase family protein [Halotalea alkalilenta]